ncbi:DUF3300 domain-containing protein [Wenzhouxiangella limi]|uniref:DUF3300 domain-containing protein n=1 Tax=Wenzhouxiangella limi TaxID=2707351 RepID=A0A845VAB1_9GAMM|nr:DUF3300 domain-containing protein [Wenzhouxiangella limi]NDY96845.1 DUF3300 domain-containing protein [Wenzhouxiangella limi]
MKRPIQTAVMATLLTLLLAPAVSARSVGDFHGFGQGELDQMLAPVALYPDTVLSHVLIAATYPLEVVQAARWSRNNPDLRGEAAVNAVIGHAWDPSVMALVAFPELLARMDADLDWTQRLGDAFLVQEEDVLDSIQRLRGQAHRAGNLGSNEHVQVVREREVIYIEPARRQVIYLPHYNPSVVYGRWHWADYPPIAWSHPRRYRSSVSFYWSPAYSVAPTFFFSSFHWSRRQVVVVNHHHHYYRPGHYSRPRTVVNQHFYSGRDVARHDSARRWTHKPTHRRGVAYRADVPARHRQASIQSSRQRAAVAANNRKATARVAETRSQQRQWAAERRSGLDRQAPAAGQPRAGRATSRPPSAENRLSTRRSSNAQTRSPARALSGSSPNSSSQRDRVKSSANRTTRTTREPSSAVPKRGLPVDQRRSQRPSNAASSARRTPPSAVRSTARPRAAAPSPSRRQLSASSRTPERARNSTVRTTRPARNSAPRAAARDRASSRQMAPTPPQRTGDRARASVDRSASRSTSRASRSQQPSRLSERAAARRRD